MNIEQDKNQSDIFGRLSAYLRGKIDKLMNPIGRWEKAGTSLTAKENEMLVLLCDTERGMFYTTVSPSERTNLKESNFVISLKNGEKAVFLNGDSITYGEPVTGVICMTNVEKYLQGARKEQSDYKIQTVYSRGNSMHVILYPDGRYEIIPAGKTKTPDQPVKVILLLRCEKYELPNGYIISNKPDRDKANKIFSGEILGPFGKN